MQVTTIIGYFTFGLGTFLMFDGFVLHGAILGWAFK